ncbi:hypothetical protein [Streptomyces sp. NBC_00842]|nr:hypothetical protein OH821_05710 [Streptomyces sp. NBC_00842]
MIVSLLYKVACKLLSVPGALLRNNTSKAAEVLVLRHENEVLRRQIAGPFRYESADRLWLAALSSLIPRHRWRRVFPVTPGTLLAWHRNFIAAKWAHRPRMAAQPVTCSVAGCSGGSAVFIDQASDGLSALDSGRGQGYDVRVGQRRELVPATA